MKTNQRVADIELIEEVIDTVVDDLRKPADGGQGHQRLRAIAAQRRRLQAAFAEVASTPVWPPVPFGARQ